MMEILKEILNTYEPIRLKEMDEVKLLNRIDKKYTFNILELPALLEIFSSDYRILDINNNRLSRYETLYFDTPDFNLYQYHHNGKLNRYKIRYRHYIDSDTSFWEIKFKNNKKRTIKKRIYDDTIDAELTDKARNFLIDNSVNPDDIVAKLWVYYSRMTLVGKLSKERLTIDINLNYKNCDKAISFPNLVIAELKQEKKNHSYFTKIMKEKHIRDIAISKYCLGIANLQDDVKKNNFKQKINLLKKLCYE